MAYGWHSERKTCGLIITHNTSAKVGNGIIADYGWHTYYRNNVIIGTKYCFEFNDELVNNSLYDDWNYNAYRSDRIGNSSEPWFKWAGTRHNNLNDLKIQTSIEQNGISIEYKKDLKKANLPSSYSEGSMLEDFDFGLTASSLLKNSGMELDNLNNTFVTDGYPDIGALEYGQPLPHYGPRKIVDPTNIIKPKLLEGLSFPNPAKNQLKLVSSKKINSVDIYSATGAFIETKKLNNQKVDVSNLNPGIYFILVRNNYYSFVKD